MGEDRIAAVQGIYEAFGRGDVEALASLFEGLEWHEAEGMPYGGVYRGAEAIFGNVIGPISRDVQGFSARPDELIPAGEDRVLALGRYRGAGSAGEVNAAFAHLWTVRDGRAVKFVQYADTHEYRRALGA